MMQQLGSIEIVSGDGQVVSVTNGWARFDPLVVLYRNSTGEPTSGHEIQFDCINSPCQFEGFGGTSGLVRAKTDAEGKATAIARTQVSGPIEIHAAAVDAPPKAFHLTAR